MVLAALIALHYLGVYVADEVDRQNIKLRNMANSGYEVIIDGEEINNLDGINAFNYNVTYIEGEKKAILTTRQSNRIFFMPIPF